MSRPLIQLPSIDSAYIDEFGAVDPDIYLAAQQIWPQAQRLAIDLLNDEHLGVELMLKAVARVSAVYRAGAEILNPKYYLLKAFKNLLLAELDKEKGREKLLQERHQSLPNLNTDEQERLNLRILIAEIRAEMDDWTKEVFDLLVMGYTFEELVPKYGSASNVIRSKYHKRLNKLTSLFSPRLNDSGKTL